MKFTAHPAEYVTALIGVTVVVLLSCGLIGCGGGDHHEEPEQNVSIQPVNCAASAVACK